MSVNSSSSLNVTLVTSSVSNFYIQCLMSIGSNIAFTLYTFTNVLFLLPLHILILYLGFQRWRHSRSAPAGQSTSHSDFFTYHAVTMEIFCILGSLVYTLGIYINSMIMLMSGLFASCIVLPGQTLFHLLTCVERYLAVVHPVTYMRLRERGGVRIRNISVMWVWLLCFGWIGVTKAYMPGFPLIPLLCMFGVSSIVIILCCLSVLFVLTRSGPGEVGRNKERVDQSKQRAFHIIRAITGVLLLRFVGLLVCFSLSYLESIRDDVCVVMDSGLFLTVPSSLVLPLLFLHKTGKLTCCRHNTESG